MRLVLPLIELLMITTLPVRLTADWLAVTPAETPVMLMASWPTAKVPEAVYVPPVMFTPL